jgi:hypothetical protein
MGGEVDPLLRAMSRHSTLLALLLGLPLTVLVAVGADPARLRIEPPTIAAGDRPTCLEIRRRDGAPFGAAAEELWVGLTFSRLVRLRASALPAARPDLLRLEIASLAELWDPPPGAGDRVLVNVYAGDVPIARSAALAVSDAAAGARPPTCEQRPPSERTGR